MSLQAVFERRRFELFYGSLILCGLALGLGQLPSLLDAPGPTDVSPIAVLLAVGGLGAATTAGWEGIHRDREEWEADVSGERSLVWLVIGFGALVVGALAYAIIGAL